MRKGSRYQAAEGSLVPPGNGRTKDDDENEED
jgi:hypothetical protein